MKKTIIALLLTIGITTAGFCQNTNLLEGKRTYTLNTNKSVVNWSGSYSFYFYEHTGIAKFLSGSLLTNAGTIIGGEFVIDMHSIDNHPDASEGGPIEHLKDTDFFDVTKYPKAKLVITNVEYFEKDNSHRFYADLTIKDITNPVEFVGYADGTDKSLKTKFKIDRTLWGITYNSKIKNKAISDAIGFEVELYF